MDKWLVVVNTVINLNFVKARELLDWWGNCQLLKGLCSMVFICHSVMLCCVVLCCVVLCDEVIKCRLIFYLNFLL